MNSPISAEDFAAALGAQLDGASGIGVACSGGADSMALLHLAHEYCTARSFPLRAATVDHGLRQEAADEAKQVAQWCAGLSIPHRILEWRHAGLVDNNIQGQAREARYALLAEWAQENNISHMLLAHHADDQAETVLWNLVRGSGVDGLSAMPTTLTRNGVHWVRPLLSFSKAQLLKICEAHGQDWVKDPSNENDAFARVWLRGWLKEFEARFASQGFSATRLTKVADNMQRARDALEHYTQSAWQTCVHAKDAGVTIAPAPFAALPEEIQLRLLLRIYQHLRPEDNRPRMNGLQRLRAWALDESQTSPTELGHCTWQKHKNMLECTLADNNKST